MLCRIMLCCIVVCCSMLYCTVVCCTMMCCAVMCCAVVCGIKFEVMVESLGGVEEVRSLEVHGKGGQEVLERISCRSVLVQVLCGRVEP